MHFKKIIFILSSTIFVGNVFATAEHVSCPPVSVIKENAVFTRAEDTMIVTVKQIYTQAYQYEGRDWETMFLFNQDFSVNEPVLKYGQDLFNKATLILKGEPIKERDGTFTCSYKSDPGINVQAYTLS